MGIAAIGCRPADLLCRLDFLILDELGYLLFAQIGGRRPRYPMLRRLSPETTVNQTGGGC